MPSRISPMPGRKHLGRQKIKMEKIQNINQLNVTFSKRRAGLFKKAYELSLMCGVEVGLICFSPAGKPFSYANPDLAHVLNRFENGGGSAIPNDLPNIDLNDLLAQIESQFEAERTKGEEHDKRCELELSCCWWRGENHNQTGLEQVQKLVDDMENLKKCLANETAKLQAMGVASAINAATKLPFNLYNNYRSNGGENSFTAGTSMTTSTSGKYRGNNYGFGPRGLF